MFPDAYLRICLFHALQSVNREISCKKMSISQSHRDLVKELFQKICYATSYETYDAECNNLKSVAAKPVWDYFEKNWNPIKEEWCSIPSCNISTYLISTTNKLESVSSKLKSVCTNICSLEIFLKNLFILLQSLRIERDNASSKVILKAPSKPLENAQEEIFFFHILTPYGFSLAKDQLKESKKN